MTKKNDPRTNQSLPNPEQVGSAVGSVVGCGFVPSFLPPTGSVLGTVQRGRQRRQQVRRHHGLTAVGEGFDAGRGVDDVAGDRAACKKPIEIFGTGALVNGEFNNLGTSVERGFAAEALKERKKGLERNHWFDKMLGKL